MAILGPTFLLLAPQEEETVFLFNVLTADLSQPFGTDMVVISEENKPLGAKKSRKSLSAPKNSQGRLPILS